MFYENSLFSLNSNDNEISENELLQKDNDKDYNNEISDNEEDYNLVNEGYDS